MDKPEMEVFDLEGRQYRFRRLGSPDTFAVLGILAEVMAMGSQDGATYMAMMEGMMRRLNAPREGEAAGPTDSPMTEGYIQPVIMLLTPLFGIPQAQAKIYDWIASTLEVHEEVETAEGVEAVKLWRIVNPIEMHDADKFPMGTDLEVLERLLQHPDMGRFSKAVERLYRNNPFKGIFKRPDPPSQPEPQPL